MNRLISKSTKFNKLNINSTPFDLKIFEEPKLECNRNSDDIPITERCSHTMRLCTASKYIETLQSSSKMDEDAKRSLFLEFNETVYQSMIDDVTHFIKEHERDIDRVHSEWTEHYGFPNCSVSKCAQTQRHYEGGRRDKKKENGNDANDDALFYFYESLYDRLHFYIFHLFDVGMRVNASSLDLNDVGDDKKETEIGRVTVDKGFAAQREHIQSRRKELKWGSERMSPENTKFTMNMAMKQTGITLTDAVFEKLKKENIPNETLQQMHQFLERNAFDSDAVEQDLEETDASNLSNVIQNQSIIDSITAFIRSVNLLRGAFSTGFKFNYQSKEEPMYIVPKYRNLKEEIIESGYLTLSRWMKFVDLKGRKYWKTRRVREMKKTGKQWNGSYDLTLEHLFVIILYCDFSELCTEFSATYRRENVFESLESVISRHSEYGNFGKLLIEMVQWFGSDRVGSRGAYGKEPGPFYCGLDCVLNTGSFAITINGPCSTTTVKEVATNFAKSDGIILKIDNDVNLAIFERVFDCSWITNYFEESERLWIGVNHPLRIVSILMIRTAKNYEKAINALYLFDAMICGVRGMMREVKQSDYKLIFNLMEWTLNGGDMKSSEMDSYLLKEWNLFLENKKNIKLNLSVMYQYTSLSELVMFNEGGMDCVRRAPEGKDNVFRPEWISMFPNVDTLEIETSYKRFRWEALVESMLSVPPLITVIVHDGPWNSQKWLRSAFTDDISGAFDAAGWNAEFDGKKLVIKSKEK